MKLMRFRSMFAWWNHQMGSFGDVKRLASTGLVGGEREVRDEGEASAG
jgi:hypothetical protein